MIQRQIRKPAKMIAGNGEKCLLLEIPIPARVTKIVNIGTANVYAWT
jgi:hypothetical protein